MFFCCFFFVFFFFNDTATTEIYTLSLHDALPISRDTHCAGGPDPRARALVSAHLRSEEHTSELQSHSDLVCRLLLEKKKKKKKKHNQERHITKTKLYKIQKKTRRRHKH